MLVFRERYQHELTFDGKVIASATTDSELRSYMQLSLGLLLSKSLNQALVMVAAGFDVRTLDVAPQENEGAR